MRQELLFLAVAISLIMNCPSAHTAEPDSGADKKDPVLIYREAGATEEQEAKIRQLAKEFEKAGKVRIERLRNLTRQITELSFEPEIDENKILALQDEINELQNALNRDRIKLMLKIRSSLTLETKTRLIELLKRKEAGHPAKAPAEPAARGTL